MNWLASLNMFDESLRRLSGKLIFSVNFLLDWTCSAGFFVYFSARLDLFGWFFRLLFG